MNEKEPKNNEQLQVDANAIVPFDTKAALLANTPSGALYEVTVKFSVVATSGDDAIRRFNESLQYASAGEQFVRNLIERKVTVLPATGFTFVDKDDSGYSMPVFDIDANKVLEPN